MNTFKTLPVINVFSTNIAPVEGREYFFQRSDLKVIHKGTCVRCEKCNKACIANAVQILSFEYGMNNITVSEHLFNAQELSYDETSEECLCESCLNKQKI